jgi:hypothetical protein
VRRHEREGDVMAMAQRRPLVRARPVTTGGADEGVASDGRAKVMAALMAGDRGTINGLVAATRLNRSTVHAHLTKLRDEGWCTWEDGQAATIRATFECAWPAYMLQGVRRG